MFVIVLCKILQWFLIGHSIFFQISFQTYGPWVKMNRNNLFICSLITIPENVEKIQRGIMCAIDVDELTCTRKVFSGIKVTSVIKRLVLIAIFATTNPKENMICQNIWILAVFDRMHSTDNKKTHSWSILLLRVYENFSYLT